MYNWLSYRFTSMKFIFMNLPMLPGMQMAYTWFVPKQVLKKYDTDGVFEKGA